IYSLGITLLYLLTGRKPYEGGTPFAIVLAHANKPLPTGMELGTPLPAEVEGLIRRMSAKKVEERYQTYDELLADLQRVREGLAPTKPTASGNKNWIPWTIGAAAVLVAGVFAALWFLKGKEKPETKPVTQLAVVSPIPKQTIGEQ